MDLLEAVPLVTKRLNDVKFLIVGDGELRSAIEAYVKRANISSKVNCTGWVQHDELPSYLNEMKLLVIPSYTEAGPVHSL